MAVATIETRINETGTPVRDSGAFHLHRDEGDRYQHGLQRPPVDLVEKRVRLSGTLIGDALINTEIDGSVAHLQSPLCETDDDDLRQIADAGFYGVTNGQPVWLQAELRDANGSTAAAQRALIGEVRSYREDINGAPIVDLLEDNVRLPTLCTAC